MKIRGRLRETKLARALERKAEAEAGVEKAWGVAAPLMELNCIARKEKAAMGAVVRLWKSYQARGMWAECGIVRAYSDALSELARAAMSVEDLSPEPPLFAAKGKGNGGQGRDIAPDPPAWHATTPPWEPGPAR